MGTPKVVVAMSGGVDSSVAAALLQEQGFAVSGMMLRLWSEPGCEDSNRCCTPDAMAQARRVAASLGIPFYAVDAQEVFHERVVGAFLEGYSRGETPNPCIICNRHIRWGKLMDYATALGADYFATGHYARVIHSAGEPARLLRGVDNNKDQSYVLSVVPQEKLAQTLLPVGSYTKPEIREIAARCGFSVANRPDSQDLCFLAGQDYRGFLARHAPNINQPGEIVTRGGEVVGMHDGLANYTIGQRKGIRIASDRPLYVIAKDGSANKLIVGNVEALGQTTLSAIGVNWVQGEPPSGTFEAQVMIRYRAKTVDAQITPIGEDRFMANFETPVGGITPGQRAVIFQGEECLGGGTIRAGGGE